MPPVGDIHTKAHELKVIIAEAADLEWAEANARKVNPGCRLYLQPEWSRREKVLPFIIDFSKANPHWMVSLQSHKYMHIP